jgi:hypothetical protein
VKDSKARTAVEGSLLKETATIQTTQHHLLHYLVECILPIVIACDSVLRYHLFKYV